MADLAREPGAADRDERVAVGRDGEPSAEEDPCQVQVEEAGLDPGMIAVEGGPGLSHPDEEIYKSRSRDHDVAPGGGGDYLAKIQMERGRGQYEEAGPRAVGGMRGSCSDDHRSLLIVRRRENRMLDEDSRVLAGRGGPARLIAGGDSTIPARVREMACRLLKGDTCPANVDARWSSPIARTSLSTRRSARQPVARRGQAAAGLGHSGAPVGRSNAPRS